MPVSAKPQQGHGASISFSSGFFAWITNISLTGIRRESLETTNMATTGARTFRGEILENYGEMRVSLQFNAATSIPIDSAAETITITWPIQDGGTVAPTWALSGFMTGFEVTADMNSIMTATATIKFSGTITITAGS